ncbi:MAG: phosphotransferase [Acidobacteriota bacterium]
MATAINLKAEISVESGFEIATLSLIKENAYCRIYRATIQDTPVIIKKYKTADSSLIEAEARALNFYHQFACGNLNLIDSKTLKLNAKSNLLIIGFVEGETLTALIWRAARDTKERKRANRAMQLLGKLLKEFYEKTFDADALSTSFVFEYLTYTSQKLESLPVIGKTIFNHFTRQADRLAQRFQDANVGASFVHGDLVFRNIHVSRARVGLIDFANTNFQSHILNDIYNLKFALANMFIPQKLKTELWQSFTAELSELKFPLIARQFYFEYHRRRWLMLKLTAHSPKDWLQALRGIATFARTAYREGDSL